MLLTIPFRNLQPYDEGEDVLVESASGKLLWNASIVAVGKNREGKAMRYRVHYTQWSTRFDEWVTPARVVEPTEHNLLAQVCLFFFFFDPSYVRLRLVTLIGRK